MCTLVRVSPPLGCSILVMRFWPDRGWAGCLRSDGRNGRWKNNNACLGTVKLSTILVQIGQWNVVIDIWIRPSSPSIKPSHSPIPCHACPEVLGRISAASGETTSNSGKYS